VLDSARHDEQLAGFEHSELALVQIVAELALPAQKQLVFVVVVPRELSFEPSEPYYRLVEQGQVLRLPGFE
jgi:hypothetical protein